MDNLLPNLIAMVFFAFLLSGLLVAFIFRQDFRNAVLGGPGEATVLGLLTVKGAAIVLLCALLIGGILFSLNALRTQAPTNSVTTAASNPSPLDVRLNVSFSPDEVNARSPNFKPEAFMKTPDGNKPIPIVSTVNEGGVSIKLTVPDLDTPFFVVFPTSKGTWQTDDYSVKESRAVAHKQAQE